MKHSFYLSDKPSYRFIPDYQDGVFRRTVIFVVAFFVSTYGGEGLVDSFNDPDFYPELAATFAITTFIIEWIGVVTRRLDKVCDWEHQPITRLCLQIGFGVLLPAAFEIFVATIWFRLIGTDIGETTFMNYAFTLIVMLIVGFNAYYLGMYMYLRWRREEAVRVGDYEKEIPSVERKVPVYFGGATRYIPDREILFVYRLGKYNYLRTTSAEGNSTYVVSQSLDELESLLDDYLFFRLNRQLIVQRECCRGHLSLEYGKIEVSLVPVSPLGGVAIVSQRRAPAFRKWIEALH